LDLGALTSGLVTGLREGVEAALIVAIILAYLNKTGNRRHFGKIWLGTGIALATSVVAGIALFVTIGTFEGTGQQLFEGTVLVLAAAVVTWMLFWMRRQSRYVKGALQARVDRVLTEGGLWSLAVLAFTAVIREGVETSLFLTTQAQRATADGAAGAASVLVGALIGLGVAVGFGFVFYQGTRRINLATFFRWTGIALIFIAGGLLANAVHEFVQVGLIGVGTQIAYDVSAVIPDDRGIGLFLRALFGYSAAPEWITLGVHVGYVALVLALYLRPLRPAPAPERVPEHRTAGA
jgi:high-affinity iron transporter